MRLLNMRATGVLTLATAAGVLAGCASSSPPASSPVRAPAGPARPAALSMPGVQRTATAADALNATADELSNVRQTVTDTLTALSDLSNPQGDLLAPFDRLISLNEEVDRADERLGQRGEDMRARARDYITNWEVEVYGVEDPDLRAQAEQRRSRVRAAYGRVSDATRELRESMDPFKRQLDDLETFLSNDLTPAGVRAARPALDRATQSGQKVQKRIDALIVEVDRVSRDMIPVTTQPADGLEPANPAAAAPPGS